MSDVGGEDGWTARSRDLIGGEAMPRDGEACGIVGRVACSEQTREETSEEVAHTRGSLGGSSRTVEAERVRGGGDEGVGSFSNEQSGGKFFQPFLSSLSAVSDGMAKELGQLSCVGGEKKRAGGSGEESGCPYQRSHAPSYRGGAS